MSAYGPIMLDVDTGVDDAAAIALAIGEEVDLAGISTVAGNVSIDLATTNTLTVLSHLGAEDVPVFRGASRPLVAPYEDASHVHGGNGLGNAEFPPSSAVEQDITGPEAIIAMAEEFDGELTLVATGPLTNVAIALSLRPQIAKQIRRLVIMGGAYFNPGNVTPHAEYNTYTDPDAAAQVFAADWNEIIAIGLDVSHQVCYSQAMWDAIPESSTGAAELLRKIVERTYRVRVRSGFFLHDPLAMGVALDPTLVTTKSLAVDVVTNGDERGKTVVRDGGKVLVADAVESTRFLKRFCAALGVPYVDDPEALQNAE